MPKALSYVWSAILKSRTAHRVGYPGKTLFFSFGSCGLNLCAIFEL